MSLEDLGSKLIASQCEPFSVCGSVLTMMLRERAINVVGDRREILRETILHFVGYKVSAPCPSEVT